MENMKRARINMTKVTAPTTQREWRIYNEIEQQLVECGIPIVGVRRLFSFVSIHLTIAVIRLLNSS